MKKLTSLLLALVMVMSLGACSSGGETKTDGATDPATSTDGGETTAPSTEGGDSDAAASDLTIAMLPKFKGENYFDACKVGAEEAAAELGLELLYDGPPQNDATNQNQVNILEGWIA